MKSPSAIAFAVVAMAPCLWDSDTLATELRGLPDAFELVVGRWHRHSDAYYQQRVDRLAGAPDLQLADYDDLAVAYERLGRRDQAIATMANKAKALAAQPDREHRYRYHANLGTFHAHAGRFDEALQQLRAAVELNPDAHFGRERFQIELIEYVAAARQQPELWTQRSFLRHAGYYLPFAIGMGEILHDPETHESHPDAQGDRALDWDQAYRAVAGMLRFGGLEGPELYRSLGELFLSQEHLNLAWWAYGRAIERGHPAAEGLARVQRAIERHWDEARKHHRTGHVSPTAADYVDKRAEADAWLARFQAAEAGAIADGVDVRSDEVLQRLLTIADGAAPGSPAAAWSWSTRKIVLLALATLLLVGLAVGLWMTMRRQPARARP